MKVGVFDSGMGGLTILQDLRQHAPQYHYLYLGDNARTPYGNRSFETILKFSEQAVDFLFQQDCQIIIIACNTSSAKALRTIQQRYLPGNHPDRRVLGVIRPSVERVPRHSSTKTVAVWATAGTVQSDSYGIEFKHIAPDFTIIQQACPLLVPLIENGELDNEGLSFFIRKYWKETVSQSDNIDVLLLGCTHYPIIYRQIKELLPPSVTVLNQGKLVGPSWKDYLDRHRELEQKLDRTEKTEFLTTDRPENFNYLAEIFLGHPVSARKVEL
ncbi:glutamate racemase [Fibrobacterota bacterium]